MRVSEVIEHFIDTSRGMKQALPVRAMEVVGKKTGKQEIGFTKVIS